MTNLEIIKNRFRLIRNRVIPRDASESVKLLTFIVVISLFGLGGFFFFFKVFKYLAGIEVIGVSLINKTIETAFFIFFSMLVFSNIITSLATFYRNKELDMLFSFPIPGRNIYLTKLFENGFYSSWATLIISLPLILAYGLVMRVSIFYYPLSLGGLLFFTIIPSTIGSIIIIGLSRLFPG